MTYRFKKHLCLITVILGSINLGLNFALGKTEWVMIWLLLIGFYSYLTLRHAKKEALEDEE